MAKTPLHLSPRSVARSTLMALSLCGLMAFAPPEFRVESNVVAATAPAIVKSEFIYEVSPYPQSHASTLAETKAGTLTAAWFGGTHERNPDVGIWFARNIGGKWQDAKELANGVQPDDKPRLPTWNPVLFQQPGGDLFLFYKVGPSPQAWWGMVITSSDDGETWSKPQRLPDGILGPIKNRTVALADGTWLSPTSSELSEGVNEAGGGGWSLYFERSEDGGRTWTKTAPVASPLKIDAIQPSILFQIGRAHV